MAVLVFALLYEQVLPEAAEALWEKVAKFGLLALIVAWLLAERYIVGGKNRETNSKLAGAITDNTKATDHAATKIEDLSRAIWQFILTKGGQTGPGSRPKEETSSTHHPQVRQKDIEGGKR